MSVRFKLYESNGITEQYTFPLVNVANYPNSSKSIIEHSNFRGIGSLTIDGGEQAWDLKLEGHLFSADCEALIVLIDDMESKVVLNTPYILKINKTISTFYEYNVKRLTPIEYATDDLKTGITKYSVTLRVNAW
jgi:hypothetical protein